MTIPAKGVPAKDIPVRKREVAAPVEEIFEVVTPEVQEVVEEAPVVKKTAKKKLFGKE